MTGGRDWATSSPFTVEAHEVETCREVREARAQRAVDLDARQAQRHVDAVVGARDVDLGAAVLGQDADEMLAQRRDQREQIRMQHVALGHVANEMRAAFLKADHDGVVDEAARQHGAAARARRDGDQRRDVDVRDPALRQRLDDLVALPFAVGGLLHVLQYATTADAEMPARRRRARCAGRDEFDGFGVIALAFHAHAIAGHGERHVETVSRLAVALVADADDVDGAGGWFVSHWRGT